MVRKILLLTMALSLCITLKVQAAPYVAVGVVEDIIPVNDYYQLDYVDFDGENAWFTYVSNDNWMVGDVFTVIRDDLGTETIYDDEEEEETLTYVGNINEWR